VYFPVAQNDILKQSGRIAIKDRLPMCQLEDLHENLSPFPPLHATFRVRHTYANWD
jgi:hypothetical protein